VVQAGVDGGNETSCRLEIGDAGSEIVEAALAASFRNLFQLAIKNAVGNVGHRGGSFGKTGGTGEPRRYQAPSRCVSATNASIFAGAAPLAMVARARSMPAWIEGVTSAV